VRDSEQRLADTFVEANILPTPLKVDALFDARFDAELARTS
jgi:hypothetical protein